MAVVRGAGVGGGISGLTRRTPTAQTPVPGLDQLERMLTMLTRLGLPGLPNLGGRQSLSVEQGAGVGAGGPTVPPLQPGQQAGGDLPTEGQLKALGEGGGAEAGDWLALAQAWSPDKGLPPVSLKVDAPAIYDTMMDAYLAYTRRQEEVADVAKTEAQLQADRERATALVKGYQPSLGPPPAELAALDPTAYNALMNSYLQYRDELEGMRERGAVAGEAEKKRAAESEEAEKQRDFDQAIADMQVKIERDKIQIDRDKMVLEQAIANATDVRERYIAEGDWESARQARQQERGLETRRMDLTQRGQDLDTMTFFLSNPIAFYMLQQLGGAGMFGGALGGLAGQLPQLPGGSMALPSASQFGGMTTLQRAPLFAEAGLRGLTPEDFMQSIARMMPGSAGIARRAL